MEETQLLIENHPRIGQSEQISCVRSPARILDGHNSPVVAFEVFPTLPLRRAVIGVLVTTAFAIGQESGIPKHLHSEG